MNIKGDKSRPVELNAADFESEVLRSKQPVLAAFLAPWSHPCQILATSLEEVALACEGSVKVVKVNPDSDPDLSIWYEIQSVPTLLYFVGGTPRARLVGTASKEAILSKLHRVLDSAESESLPPDGTNE